MATVPTPYDATAAVKLTATAWDAGVRDPLTFLLDPPKVGAYQNAAGTSLVNATSSGPLLYDAESVDSDNMHSTASNQGRITFNTAGRYLINVFVMLPNVTTYTVYTVNPRLNSGGTGGGTSIRSFDLRSPGGAPAQSAITFTRVFAAGDYMEIYVTQTSGSTRVTDFGNGQYATGVQAQWVSIN